jgi:hypothetical protein
MKILVLRSFVCVSVLIIAGCLESSFKLSDDSRLPKWFVLPEGKDRDNYSVQMELHSTMTGGKAVIKFYQDNELLPVQKYSITTDEQPQIRSRSIADASGGYPRYKIVTINGVTDIVELRKMEPVFYMTDDPAVWSELGVEQKK